MDVYISRRALKELQAAVLLHAEKENLGFLIGHKRGHRYFIENIIPSLSDILINEKFFFSLNDLFSDKVIGFFSLSPNKTNKKTFFNPIGAGKILLEIRAGENRILNLESFQIDYEDGYKLKPIEISLKELRDKKYGT